MIPKSQLISLSAVPGMGPRRIRSLLRKYIEVEDITMLSKLDVMQVDGLSGELAGKTKNIDWNLGEQAVNSCFLCDFPHIDNVLVGRNALKMKVTMCYKDI